MKISKTHLIYVVLIAVLFMFNACSNGKSPIEPVMNDGQINSGNLPDSLGEQSDNRTILAGYEATIDPAAKEFTVTPTDRNSQYHFPLTSNYPNVLQITDYGWTPNFWADIKLVHPFPNTGIDAFDPRVIAILPANPGVSMDYPACDVQANNSVILEPDGYTKLFDSVNASIVGNANPFIAYFKDEPNRVWSSTETTEETKRWDMDISGFGGPLQFTLVVDVSTNYPNSPQPIIDNVSEPVQMETSIRRDLSTYGGGSIIDVTLLDWQGEAHIKCEVESPQLFNGTIELFYSVPGSNPNEYIFSGYISNSNLAPAGNYNLLISAWDVLTNIHLYSEETASVSVITDGNLVWAKSDGGTDAEYGSAITVLSDNSIVVTGYFEDSATFGLGELTETVLTSAGYEDVFVARYNPDGTLAWAKRAGGVGRDYAMEITALADNSTVVTGYYDVSTTFGLGEANETFLINRGSEDIFVAKYNPDGTLAWAKWAAGGGSDCGYGITSLSDSSTVVTGKFSGSAMFGFYETNETVLNSAGASDVFIEKYNPDGSLAFAKSAGGANVDGALGGITTLSDNFTVVTGYFVNSAIFGSGEINETLLTSAGIYDIFVARYNPDGSLAWAKSAGGSDVDEGYGITTLSDNSTVVTGFFNNSATFGKGEPNETILINLGIADIFIAKYNPDGNLAWVKRAGGETWDRGHGITSLSDDSTVVTGYFYDAATFGKGEINETVLSSEGDADIFIARYNPDGTLDWVAGFGGSGGDLGLGIATLSDDSTVVTGSFWESVTFGSGEPNETVLTSYDHCDTFIARFDP